MNWYKQVIQLNGKILYVLLKSKFVLMGLAILKRRDLHGGNTDCMPVIHFAIVPQPQAQFAQPLTRFQTMMNWWRLFMKHVVIDPIQLNRNNTHDLVFELQISNNI